MIPTLLLSLGILAFIAGWWLLKSDKNFTRQSYEVTGTCVRLVKRIFRSDGETNVCWFKIFHYQADGRLWEIEGTTGMMDEYTIVIGQPAKIRVSKSNPANARSIEDISDRQGLVGLLMFGGVFALIFAFVLGAKDGGLSLPSLSNLAWPAMLIVGLLVGIQLVWPQIQYLLPIRHLQQFMPATEVEQAAEK
ncbi:DUF3592 domain-containing protein [Oceanobacter kriegii]|uniref:DUF3592 domain-containing protein n=1 Tax=Oceanobacter kriegii TaxID=64972 RepID=UPI00040823D7|nr:DUF3592 domain-containing protein [Oceanobacter kriegii]